MARLLADRDSTNLHLLLARRHERLARRYGQKNLASSILAVITTLKTRQTEAEERQLDRQSAYDNVLAADGDLDDAVRSLFNAAENHDRANVGAGTLALLFPDGGFGGLVNEPYAQQPASVDALVTKLNSLGATHPLATHATALTQRA